MQEYTYTAARLVNYLARNPLISGGLAAAAAVAMYAVPMKGKKRKKGKKG